MNENRIEGRNAVIEAFRAGRTIDRLYMLDGSREGAMQTVRKEAAKQGTPIKYVTKQRLDQMSETGRHQGVIAEIAAYSYGEIEDLFEKAAERGEDPFFILLDGIDHPYGKYSGRARRDHSEGQGCRIDCHSGESICRSDQLHACRKGH